MKPLVKLLAVLLVLPLLGLAGCGQEPESTRETNAPETQAQERWYPSVLEYDLGALNDICLAGDGCWLAAETGVHRLDVDLRQTGEVRDLGTSLLALQGDRLVYRDYDIQMEGCVLRDEEAVIFLMQPGHGLDKAQLWAKGEDLWFCDGYQLYRNGTEVSLPQEPGSFWRAAALAESEGELFAVLTRSDPEGDGPAEAWLVPVDSATEALAVKDGTALPDAARRAEPCCGEDTGLLYADGTLWQLRDRSLTPFLELTRYGINPSTLRRVLVTGDGRVLCLDRDGLLVLFTRKPETAKPGGQGSGDPAAIGEPVLPAEQKTLRIGALEYCSNTTETLIAYVNRLDGPYRLEGKTYETAEQLNLALLNGELDLLTMYDDALLRNYAEKGLLEPIDELLPERFSSGLLYENLVEALRFRDHCYYLPPIIKLYGNLLPKSYGVEPEDVDSLAALAAIMEEQEPETFTFELRESVFFRMVGQTMDHWLDEEAGTARFDSEAFIELLEFCNRFVLTPEESLANQTGISAYDKPRFVIFTSLTVGASAQWMYFDYFSLPYAGVKPLTLYCDTWLAPVRGADRDALRDFFETVLSDDGWYEKTTHMYDRPTHLPTTRTINAIYLNRKWTEQDFNLKIEETLANKDYHGEDYSDEAFLESVETLRTMISEASQFMSIGSEIRSMLTEEARACFNGEISAQEAASRIQNRVEIYLSERR